MGICGKTTRNKDRILSIAGLLKVTAHTVELTILYRQLSCLIKSINWDSLLTARTKCKSDRSRSSHWENLRILHCIFPNLGCDYLPGAPIHWVTGRSWQVCAKLAGMYCVHFRNISANRYIIFKVIQRLLRKNPAGCTTITQCQSKRIRVKWLSYFAHCVSLHFFENISFTLMCFAKSFHQVYHGTILISWSIKFPMDLFWFFEAFWGSWDFLSLLTFTQILARQRIGRCLFTPGKEHCADKSSWIGVTSRIDETIVVWKVLHSFILRAMLHTVWESCSCVCHLLFILASGGPDWFTHSWNKDRYVKITHMILLMEKLNF